MTMTFDEPILSAHDEETLSRAIEAGLLADHAAVTSGREVWSSTNVLPEGHPGVPGEVFFDRSGFTFGSPHLALYRRAELLSLIHI